MKKKVLSRARNMNKTRRYRQGWQAFVRTLALCVVFCTTYILILPAITIQEDAICGFTEHTHSPECYSQPQATLLGCEMPGNVIIAHRHNDLCSNEGGELVCTLAEIVAHTHDEGCYTLAEEAVACPVPGETGTEPTGEEHTHEDSCYKQQTCTMPELQLHSHGEDCFDAEGALICALPEVVEHMHSDACLVAPAGEEAVLVCELEEHIHQTDCYPLEEEPVFAIEYICGYSVHTHNENCLAEDGTVNCSIPEHTHEAACAVEDLDLTADVETEEDWMKSVSGMTLTGNWPADLLAVAQTQLDYRESVKNVVLAEEELKGYTRYGAWHGEPYADWNTLFAAFCLDYAAVKDFPVETDAERWVQVLTENQLYRAADAYSPKPGDLIFLDLDQIPDAPEPVSLIADRVGIVAELLVENGEATAVKLIAGDQNNQVSYVTYEMTDPVLAGYAELPEGDFKRATAEGEDYTVTVTYSQEAGIPENAELIVQEILPDTEEYETYYLQAVAALMKEAMTEEEPEVSFARFFDISFVADGVTVEPATAVDIEIVYSNTIAVKEIEKGQVVHFAKDGVEVLRSNTSLTESGQEAEAGILSEIAELFTGKTELVDTFRFTQDGFSVTGTLVSTNAITTATKVNPWEIDDTGNTMYVLYAQIGNRYYALSGTSDSYPVEITVSGNTITLPANNTENLYWTFVDKPNDNTNYRYNPVANVGTGRYLHPFNNGGDNQNITTGNPYDVDLVVSNDTFKVRGANNNYVRFRSAGDRVLPTTNQNQATNFYVAAVGSGTGGSYNVWFDGTLGGMMSYYGAANENIPAAYDENGEAVVELPETWQSSTKYDYVLRGWYDINNQKYYAVNPNDNIQPTATITGNTVFYADWIAATYDVGINNEHVVQSLDTSDFITTYVFDYNALFNVMSQSHTGTITAAGHSETWRIYNNGETVPYQNGKSLGFVFVDYDNGGEISYANERDTTNINQSGITSGIIAEVANNSGQDLMDLLFNPETEAIGKYYVGTGNYLFQYMDSTTANYDGEHNGYYYLDARLNAASYNKSQGRFYVYDYLERTSDSRKDGGAGQYSDLLPFNSPYIFDADQVDVYTDPVRRPGYEYDAKDGGDNFPEYNSLDDAATNYFFGLRTDIEFFLPNDTNTQDEYGNYGNISTRGEHMVFDFHGDDDVWVFVDGQLLLDIGGVHGIMHGRIDFSTGTISYGADGSESVSRFTMSEGTHTMTVYYMERGSSQSNCAIYFNIAPRYDLEITKEDIVTADKLDGAVFSIYNDEAMTEPAELWNSFEEHEAGAAPTNTFTVVNGVAKCWGISAGKTYYIYETTPPPGYPASDDMIRITLNNRGTATIETTTLHGQNGVATEGFAVIKQDVNDTLKIVALTVTNQLEGDTTEVRVEKTWDENSTNLPPYIIVYLTADGVRIGRTATLTEANGWSYTWTGLPKYRTEGIDQEIEYVVEEVFVPNYITVQGDSVKVENYVDWVRVDQMSDSKTFLLVHNGMALTYDGSFGWMDRTAAEADTSLAAHWNVTTDHDGFHLKNSLGYTLTYDDSGFYGVDDDAVSLNQVFYYLNSRLVVHDHDVYYQFGANGTVVQEDGLAFQLYQKEVLTGFLINIVNKPVDEEKQTFVEVNKVWADGADKHLVDSVVIHLYADGKDTGRYLVLDASNNWSGVFDDLPYYHDGTTTEIVYTVVEDEVRDYVPSYSDPVSLTGRPVSFWQNVSELIAGDAAYRFYANGYALAVASDNDVYAAQNDPEDTSQQWKVVSSDKGLLLQNVGTNRYLQLINTDLSTTGSADEATVVAMSDGYLTVGQYYLELRSGYVGVTANSANIDKASFRMTRWVTTTGMNGTGYTVTNSIGYSLPETGGAGIPIFTFGGLLMIAASLMYISITGRMRRKGGR